MAVKLFHLSIPQSVLHCHTATLSNFQIQQIGPSPDLLACASIDAPSQAFRSIHSIEDMKRAPTCARASPELARLKELLRRKDCMESRPKVLGSTIPAGGCFGDTGARLRPAVSNCSGSPSAPVLRTRKRRSLSRDSFQGSLAHACLTVLLKSHILHAAVTPWRPLVSRYPPNCDTAQCLVWVGYCEENTAHAWLDLEKAE